MVKTLICIPRMLTKTEIIKLVGSVPEDYEAKYEEFWSYVEERLRQFEGRIRRVYHDMIFHDRDEGVQSVRSVDLRVHGLVAKLVQSGGEFYGIDDRLLLAEYDSWLDMMNNRNNEVLLECLKANLRDRDAYAKRVVEESMKEGEFGVLLLSHSRRIEFSERVKLIRMLRFEPIDYITSVLSRVALLKTTSDQLDPK